jgi:mono/diheme cytochrome c family protein
VAIALAAGAFGLEATAAARKPKGTPASAAPALDYAQAVAPLLQQYCVDCHGERRRGGVDLRSYTNEPAALAARSVFERVLAVVRAQEMPPPNRPQPSGDERARMVDWLQSTLFRVDCERPDPGHVTLRRLNRIEYNHTIRDLVGLDLCPADEFPADDAGYGFDNIGDVLSLSPLLFERYLAAAAKVLQQAIVSRPVPGQPLPESHRRIFFGAPAPGQERETARAVIGLFARRAFRRPVTTAELDRLLGLFVQAQAAGEPYEASVAVALQAVLVSPHFLFREEPFAESAQPAAVELISEFALASRLSYFLWSSMPDDELSAHAERGTLRRNLEGQVLRLLHDPKARALVHGFASQWLQLRNLELVAPDPATFPQFDAALRGAMREETERFFAHIVEEDGRVLDFLGADYTFVNARLAGHYGLAGVTDDGFQRVSLRGTARGGLLTQASILTLTSNPTRTSPVKRGKWVLENLLGTPPPPPPPNVPELSEVKEAVLSGTLRQRLEQHRADPACAGCHARMDPIGFGLEHFDGVGAWRERDGEFAIDAAGQLVTGERFSGAVELRRLLRERHAEEFLRCLAGKLLTYALGRGLEYYDSCALDRIVEGTARGHHRFSALVLEITRSVPFQMRRADGPPDSRAAVGRP